ncbi:MAG: hypothetical protein JXA20_13985 [Spirochaetes bacterium]|nr:hypothetical protein [Spirochaetota bacterium]
MAGTIPKRLYQILVTIFLVPTFGLMVFDFTGDAGIFAAVKGGAGHGAVGALLAFIATLFAYFVPWVAVALVLRRFSDMPGFTQELSGMEGGGVVDKMRSAYRQESRKLEELKGRGSARYYRRMALGGIAVFAVSTIALAAVVFLLGRDALMTIAEYRLGLALLLAPPISLVLTIYYAGRGRSRK